MLTNLPRLSIAVLGSGPRALASAICLARHHRVKLGETFSESSQRRVARIPVYPGEPDLNELAHRAAANIEFVDTYSRALPMADLVVVAEQPLYRTAQRSFDMSAIEQCLDAVARYRPRATVVLEAPTPVGYARSAGLRHRIHVIPAPLLMRQGCIAGDRSQPQRILVGDVSETGLSYAFIAVRSCRDPGTPYLLVHSSEAEAIHAFERKRSLRGHSESHDEVTDFCQRHRLNENQVLKGLQTLDYVSESIHGELHA
ncbi:MAG: hypothetical protein Q8S92_03570 [Hydrogenophaga sp.]|nr:hypothetical protein [Hydrogenophaga sp.]MDP3348059.1 hypothetical protein [Hydrogenophaga sp.]